MRLRLARSVAGYRNEHRLTCEDMAGQLGISPPTLRKILRAEDVSLTLSTTHRLLCQHHAQCVALLRRDLSGPEALIAVPCNVAVLLTIALLGKDHLLKGQYPSGIDGSDELPCSGLVGILGAGKHIEKIL